MSTPGIVEFNYGSWVARYPDLGACVGTELADSYFVEAGLYLNNTPCSVVRDLAQRSLLLGMLVAHIAALNANLNGQPSSPIVGRISSATEGSVSVQAQFDMPPGSAQWFAQTKYGAAFWQASAQFRTMRYIPSPARVVDPYARTRRY